MGLHDRAGVLRARDRLRCGRLLRGCRDTVAWLSSTLLVMYVYVIILTAPRSARGPSRLRGWARRAAALQCRP